MSMLFVTILVDLTLARVNLDIQAMAKIALVRFFFYHNKNNNEKWRHMKIRLFTQQNFSLLPNNEFFHLVLLPLAKVVLVSYFHLNKSNLGRGGGASSDNPSFLIRFRFPIDKTTNSLNNVLKKMLPWSQKRLGCSPCPNKFSSLFLGLCFHVLPSYS